MSHIHIPDGVLPIIWWLMGFVVVGIILTIAVKKLEKGDLRKKIPYIGVVGALMLITMSIPVGPLPFHINLTVLTGILAGPWLGFIAIFIVNLFLAFLGHGGITVVGINTFILGVEMLLGWKVFYMIRRYSKESLAAGVATVVALLISTMMMFSIVGFSQVGWEYAMPHKHDAEEHMHLAEGQIEEEHVGVTLTESEAEEQHEHDNHQGYGEKFKELILEVSFFNISGIAALLLIVIIGITLETLVTVFIVRFFKKVRPDLLQN